MADRATLEVKIQPQLKPIHDMNIPPQVTTPRNPAVALVLKLGLDIDLHTVVTAIQCGYDAIAPRPKVHPRVQVAVGHTVVRRRTVQRNRVISLPGCQVAAVI